MIYKSKGNRKSWSILKIGKIKILFLQYWGYLFLNFNNELKRMIHGDSFNCNLYEKYNLETMIPISDLQESHRIYSK